MKKFNLIIIVLMGFALFWIFSKNRDQNMEKDLQFELTPVEGDASGAAQANPQSELSSRAINPDEIELSLAENAAINIERFKQYTLQNALRGDRLKITQEDIERVLKIIGRSPLHLVTAGMLLLQSEGPWSISFSYIKEAFSKEKSALTYYAMAIMDAPESNSETILNGYKNADPKNLIPDILLERLRAKNGERINVAKLEESFLHKKILYPREGINQAGVSFLENLGIEKETADYMGTFLTPSNYLQMGSIYEFMVENEFQGKSKHEYSKEEKLRVLSILSRLGETKKDILEEHFRTKFQKDITDLENDDTQKQRLEEKFECLVLLSKEIPFHDFSYQEAENYAHTVKEEGSYAAKLQFPGVRQALEAKGCGEFFYN